MKPFSLPFVPLNLCDRCCGTCCKTTRQLAALWVSSSSLHCKFMMKVHNNHMVIIYRDFVFTFFLAYTNKAFSLTHLVWMTSWNGDKLTLNRKTTLPFHTRAWPHKVRCESCHNSLLDIHVNTKNSSNSASTCMKLMWGKCKNCYSNTKCKLWLFSCVWCICKLAASTESAALAWHARSL